MIDLRLLRAEPDTVRRSQEARGEDPGSVDAILRADAEGRAALAAFEAKRAEQKALGKSAAGLKGPEKDAALAALQTIAADVRSLETKANDATQAANELAWAIPNVVEEGAPPGGEADLLW